MTLTYLVTYRAKKAGYPIPFWLGFAWHDIALRADVYAVRPLNWGIRWSMAVLRWTLNHIAVRENIRPDYCEGNLLTADDFIHREHQILWRVCYPLYRAFDTWHDHGALSSMAIAWFVVTRADIDDWISQEAKDFAQSEYWRGVHEPKRLSDDEYLRIFKEGGHAHLAHLNNLIGGKATGEDTILVERTD